MGCKGVVITAFERKLMLEKKFLQYMGALSANFQICLQMKNGSPLLSVNVT